MRSASHNHVVIGNLAMDGRVTAAGLTDRSVAELGQGLRSGLFSSVDIVKAHLDAIDLMQPILNAFVRVEVSSALSAAKRADRELKAGRDRGLLLGIPIAVKDLIALANVPMLAGSAVYRRRPKRDAAIIAAFRKAGAIVIGSTRLHEIALGPTGLNPHDGGARNPKDLGRIPGGSSSGSAVAVAARLSPIALGTDTGGSVRIPAALCGVVGLKPTHGLLSTSGVMPLSPTLDHVGLLARSVSDIEVTLTAFGLPIAHDDRRVVGERFGVLVDACTELEPGVRAAFARSVDTLRAAGAHVAEVTLPESASVVEVSSTVLFYEAHRVHRARLRTDPLAFGSDIRQRLMDGSAISRATYCAALRSMERFRAAADALFSKVSFLLSPTVPVHALSLAEAADARRRALLPRNTRLFNMLGVPAISIPIPDSGLPAGLQVAAPLGADGAVLTVARAIETLQR